MRLSKETHNNGMGLIRYVLSFAVIVAHFNWVTGSEYYFPISSYHAVGAFFSLSGFLIFPSYMRSAGLKDFLSKRARKILPPYLFIVISCALLLYFTVPTSERGDYFSWGWVKYLAANLTFLNFLEPGLPGVFDGRAVNGSLWTIKIEWLLYLSVPLVIWIIRKFNIRRISLLCGCIYIISAAYRLLFLKLYYTTDSETFNILSRQVFGQLCYFYSGVMIYQNFRLLSSNFLIYITIALAGTILSNYVWWAGVFIEPISVSVLVIGLSMWLGGKISVFNSNNASYEMYLFHLPVIQTLWQYRAALGLGLSGCFCASLVMLLLLSFIIWFILDKPVLKKRFRRLKMRK